MSDLFQWSEVVLLGILFFVARDLPLGDGFGSRVVLVFLFYNLASLTLNLHLLTRRVYEGSDFFAITMAGLHCFWIICVSRRSFEICNLRIVNRLFRN